MEEENQEPAEAPFLKLPWYFTKKTLVLGLLLVGPLALPLLWLNPVMSARAKVLWTAVIFAAMYALSALSAWAFQSLRSLL